MTDINKGLCLRQFRQMGDQKTRDKSAVIEQDTIKMHFVTIAPIKSDKKKLQVALYQYRYGQHLLADKKEVDL